MVKNSLSRVVIVATAVIIATAISLFAAESKSQQNPLASSNDATLSRAETEVIPELPSPPSISDKKRNPKFYEPFTPSEPLPDSELTHLVFPESWLLENDQNPAPNIIEVMLPEPWMSNLPVVSEEDVPVELTVPTKMFEHRSHSTYNESGDITISFLKRYFSGWTPEPGPPALASMSVVPDKQSVSAGDSFTVDVLISTKEASRGAQCTLIFDAAVMRFEEFIEGSFYKGWADSNGGFTMVLTNPVMSKNGLVSATAIAIIGGNKGGPVGSGVFGRYRFTALTHIDGPLPVSLKDVKVGDDTGYHEIPCSGK